MKRLLFLLTLASILLANSPLDCPAPIVYRPGEGWSYEPVGGNKWERSRAKDQMEVAEKAFAEKDYFVAQKAARRVVRNWPYSDYAPHAQYLMARCLEERKMDERAFTQYQKLLEKYPKYENYNEVIDRQMMIANRFLAGQGFKLWGYIPLPPSMDRTAKLYGEIIKRAPYHSQGPHAQMNIGTAREKQRSYLKAAKAYEKAADRYSDRPRVASEALWKAGEAGRKQSSAAEYDQGAAVRAIDTYNDFMTLYPEDSRVPQARVNIIALRTEQARGSFLIAKFYEKYHKRQSAIIYYNEVLVKDPDSPYAPVARERMELLKKQVAEREAAKKSKQTAVSAAETK